MVHECGTPTETTTLTYDALGRPYTRTTGTFSTTWSYDALGHMVQAASDITTQYSFDPATGRPTGRTDINGANWTISTSYSFDDRDRLKTITYPTAYPNPGGRTVTYTYDDLGGPGRLSGVLNGASPFASDFSYDGRGRLQSYLTGAVTQSFAYDRQNRTTTVATAGVQGTPDLGLSYGYQRNGNVWWIGDTRFTTAQVFGYDALDRLTSASGGVMGTTTLGWTYDATGNRTTETNGTTTTYQYDATTQRLTGIVGGESFTYDGFGRVTQDGQATYTYRSDGSLLTATRTGMTASYLYDADGLRVRSVVNGARLISIHGLGGQLLTEFDSINAVLYWKRDLIYAGGRLIGSVKKGTGTPPTEYAEYYASDTLGSVRLVFNAAGAVVGRSDYLPYGDALNVAGTLPKERFTGQQHDAETGLEFMNARSMQARTGRMNQPDPLMGNALVNPQRWNRYAYVLNNPLKMIDPTGMDQLVFHSGVTVSYFPDYFSTVELFGTGGMFFSGLDAQDPMNPKNGTSLGVIDVGNATASTETSESPETPSSSTPPSTQTTPAESTQHSPSSASPGGSAGTTISRAAPATGRSSRPSADYGTISVGVGGLFGVVTSCTRDSFGHLYCGVGPSVGKSYTIVSVTLEKGNLLTTKPPTEVQLADFLTAWSVNLAAYLGVGGSVSGNFSGVGLQSGVGTPQLGGSVVWNWLMK